LIDNEILSHLVLSGNFIPCKDRLYEQEGFRIGNSSGISRLSTYSINVETAQRPKLGAELRSMTGLYASNIGY